MTSAPSTTDDRRLVFRTSIRVRWGDMDAMRHVNNSRYFTYFEQARVDWLASLASGWAGRRGPTLARASCDFKRPLTYPATLDVHVLIGPPGRKSLTTYYEARAKGEEAPCATGEAVLVWFDYEEGRSVPLPDAIRACYDAAEAPVDAQAER